MFLISKAAWSLLMAERNRDLKWKPGIDLKKMSSVGCHFWNQKDSILFQCKTQTHFQSLRAHKIARPLVANKLHVQRHSWLCRLDGFLLIFSWQNVLSEEGNPWMARSSGAISVTVFTENGWCILLVFKTMALSRQWKITPSTKSILKFKAGYEPGQPTLLPRKADCWGISTAQALLPIPPISDSWEARLAAATAPTNARCVQ